MANPIEEEEDEKRFSTGAMKDLAGYLEYTDIQRLLQGIASDEESKAWRGKGRDQDWLLVFLLSRTGRRISEVLPLKPADIQWGKHLVQFRILKKKSPLVKLKPVDSTVLEQLDTYRKKWKMSLDDYFFASPYKIGRHLTRNWAYKRVRHLVEKHLGQRSIGKKYPHPHHFRHSFAINFLEASNKPNALALLQGTLEHSSLNVTGHYLQFSPKEQLEALEDLFSDSQGLGSDSDFKANIDLAQKQKKYLNIIDRATPRQLENWRNAGDRMKKAMQLKKDGFYKPNYMPPEQKKQYEEQKEREEQRLKDEKQRKDKEEQRKKNKDPTKVYDPFGMEMLD